MNGHPTGADLLDLAYGGLEDGDDGIARTHLASCPSCRDLSDRLTRERAALKGAVTSLPATSSNPWRRFLPPAFAAILLVGILGLILSPALKLAGAPARQEALDKRVDPLVEKLGDDDIEIRETAEAELKALWKEPGVVAFLENRIIRCTDPETNNRLKSVVSWISFRKRVPDGMVARRGTFPDEWLGGDTEDRLRVLEEYWQSLARPFTPEEKSMMALQGVRWQSCWPEVTEYCSFISSDPPIIGLDWIADADAARKMRVLAILEPAHPFDHPVLLRCLEDSDSGIRQKAAEMLAGFSRDARSLLKHPSGDVRLRAIEKLKHHDAGAIAALLADPVPAVRSAAASALGQMMAGDQADGVAGLLKDPDPAVRLQAVTSLGWIRSGLHADRASTLLADEHPDVRAAAALALGRMRARRFSSDIASLPQTDPLLWIRALSEMGAADQLQHVKPFMIDDDPVGLGGEAAMAATRWKDRDGAAFLIRHLDRMGVHRARASLCLSVFLDPALVERFEAAGDTLGSFFGCADLNEMARRVKERAGLTVEVPADLPQDDQAAWEEYQQAPEDLLIYIAKKNVMPILEAGRIRLLPHEEGIRFWRAWWEKKR